MSASPESGPGFRDYYEILQLSPTADDDTISRVYRILIKRYHPDNQTSANPQKFADVLEAYKVLSDPDKRTAYDVKYEESRASTMKIFEEASDKESFGTDRRLFDGILSLLYAARRREPGKGGMGTIQIEKLLGCPAEHLEFHLWYLLEKRWVERQSNGRLAITVQGIDHMMEQDLMLRRDRLIPEHASEDGGPKKLED